MIMFYSAEKNDVTETMLESIADELPDWPLTKCNSLVSLENRMRRAHADIEVIVINVSNAQEMCQLDDMRDLLLDVLVIMTLPYQNEALIKWAHRFFPRFIDFVEHGCRRVGPVLAKMSERGQISPKIPIGELKQGTERTSDGNQS